MEPSPLPKDLAHPRRDIRDRVSLVANIVTGVVLLVVTAALVSFWLATQ